MAGRRAEIELEGNMMEPFEDARAYWGEGITHNILSDADVKDSWKIDRIYNAVIDCYQLTRRDTGEVVHFHFNPELGQFVANLDNMKKEGGSHARCLLHSTYYHRLGCTKEMIKRMLKVEDLHKSLDYTNLSYIAMLAGANVWANGEIHPSGVQNYKEYMHGRSCIGCLCGKSRKAAQENIEYRKLNTKIGECVCVDLLYLSVKKEGKISQAAVPILLAVDEYSKHKYAVFMKSKHEEELMQALLEVVAI